MTAALHLTLAMVLFLFYPCALNETLSAACLALTLPADLWLLRGGLKGLKLRRGALPLALAAGGYMAFALFARDIFGMGEKMLTLGAPQLGCFLLMTLWAWGMVLAGLGLLESLRTMPARLPSPEKGSAVFFRRFIPMFAVFALIQGMFVIMFYPGGYPADSGSVIQQALGLRPLTDANPFLNTMLMKLLLPVGRVWFITLVQALGYAAVTAWFMTELCAEGLSPVLGGVLGAIFLLLPNQAVNSIDVVKDTPFTYALLCTMLLMFRLIREPGRDRSIGWIAGMTVSLFGVACLRHNGVIVALAVCAVLGVLGLVLLVRKKGRRVRQGRRLLITAVAACMLFSVWRGPVMRSAVDVQPDEISAFTALQQGVAAVISNDLPLSEESTALMESALPLSEWKAYYDPWAGPDAYMERPDGSPEMKREGLTTASLLKAWLEALGKYPAVIIKDRLNATDLLWDAVQPAQSFNARYFQGVTDLIPEELLAWPAYDSLVSKLCRTLYGFYQPNVLNASWHGLADSLLWRTGLYLVLCVVLAVWWYQRRMAGMLLPGCLVIFHAGVLMLCLYHQSFRYVYAVQPMTLMLLGMTIALSRKRS